MTVIMQKLRAAFHDLTGQTSKAQQTLTNFAPGPAGTDAKVSIQVDKMLPPAAVTSLPATGPAAVSTALILEEDLFPDSVDATVPAKAPASKADSSPRVTIGARPKQAVSTPIKTKLLGSANTLKTRIWTSIKGVFSTLTPEEQDQREFYSLVQRITAAVQERMKLIKKSALEFQKTPAGAKLTLKEIEEAHCEEFASRDEARAQADLIYRDYQALIQLAERQAPVGEKGAYIEAARRILLNEFSTPEEIQQVKSDLRLFTALKYFEAQESSYNPEAKGGPSTRTLEDFVDNFEQYVQKALDEKMGTYEEIVDDFSAAAAYAKGSPEAVLEYLRGLRLATPGSYNDKVQEAKDSFNRQINELLNSDTPISEEVLDQIQYKGLPLRTFVRVEGFVRELQALRERFVKIKTFMGETLRLRTEFETQQKQYDSLEYQLKRQQPFTYGQFFTLNDDSVLPEDPRFKARFAEWKRFTDNLQNRRREIDAAIANDPTLVSLRAQVDEKTARMQALEAEHLKAQQRVGEISSQIPILKVEAKALFGRLHDNSTKNIDIRKEGSEEDQVVANTRRICDDYQRTRARENALVQERDQLAQKTAQKTAERGHEQGLLTALNAQILARQEAIVAPHRAGIQALEGQKQALENVKINVNGVILADINLKPGTRIDAALARAVETTKKTDQELNVRFTALQKIESRLRETEKGLETVAGELSSYNPKEADTPDSLEIAMPLFGQATFGNELETALIAKRRMHVKRIGKIIGDILEPRKISRVRASLDDKNRKNLDGIHVRGQLKTYIQRVEEDTT